MTELVLRPLTEPVKTFLEQITPPRKRAEAEQLITLFQQVTGLEPVIWGGGIIGFGKYHYKYDSGRQGDAPLAAFAPCKARHSIYLEPKFPERKELLTQLGKHKESLGCIYINKLPDVDLVVLKELITASTKETLRKRNQSQN